MKWKLGLYRGCLCSILYKAFTSTLHAGAGESDESMPKRWSPGAHMVVEGESTHPDLIARFYSAIPGPARNTDQRIQWFDDVGIDNTVQRYIPGLLLCVLVALQRTQAEYDGLAVVHEPEYLKLTALWIGKSRGFRIVGDQVYRDWSKDFSDMPIYSSICEPLPLPFHHVVFSP